MKREKDTEERILNAAKTIFQEKGMAGARMQEIADKAEINKALLHYYFRSKEKLFQKIFQDIIYNFLMPILKEFNTNKPLEVKIWNFTESYLEMLKKNPHVPIFMLSEIRRNPETLQEIANKEFKLNNELLQSQIDEEVEKGNYKPTSFINLFINIISLCAFPFAAEPMLKTVFNMNDQAFHDLIEERKQLVPNMIIAGLKNS